MTVETGRRQPLVRHSGGASQDWYWSIRHGRRRRSCTLTTCPVGSFVLKRHLDAQGKPITGKPLVELIDLAVSDLGLSSQLCGTGLQLSAREATWRFMTRTGWMDDARADDLPWLFQAVDSLVDELHTNPQEMGSASKLETTTCHAVSLWLLLSVRSPGVAGRGAGRLVL